MNRCAWRGTNGVSELVKRNNLGMVKSVANDRVNKKKKILILSTELFGGGAEYVTKLMVKTLENSLCVLFTSSHALNSVEHRVIVLRQFSRSNILVRIVQNIYRVIHIQLIKLKTRPVVTISHLEGPNFSNMLTCLGGKTVIFSHNLFSKNYSEYEFTSLAKKLLIRILYRRADVAVGVSRDICDELTNEYGVQKRRVTFIPNPINVNEIDDRSRQEYGDWRDELLTRRYLVNVASFSKQKNHLFLVEVFKLIKERQIDLKLVLLGDGKEKDNIVDICGKLNLVVQGPGVDNLNQGADVYLLGHQINPYPLVREADAFLLTSGWEGMPISLLEAMALRTPVVVSGCSSAIKELMTDQYDKDEGTYSTSCDRTQCGILMATPPTGGGSNMTVAGEWADAIIGLLEDSEYRSNCMHDERRKAEKYDISRISKLWYRYLFSEDAELN